MATTTQSLQTWKKEIDAYIQDEQDNMPKSVYTQLFGVESTNRLRLHETTWAGMGPMVAVGELEDAVSDDVLEGYDTTFNQVNFRKSTTFSSNVLKTDQTSTVKKMASDIAKKPEYSRNLNLFSVLRRGWDSLKPYGDAKPLISTAHPRKDGGTAQTNTFSDGVQLPLSYDNALTLQDQLIAMVSNSGNLLAGGDQGRNKTIICSPYQREEAYQIAGVEANNSSNPAQGQPGTAENNMNYFVHGDKFDVLTTRWVSYEAALQAGETAVAKTATGNYWDDMWFICDTALADRYFKMFYLEGYPKFTDEITKANEALVKYAYDTYAYGVTSYLPIVGSKGDNTTYSG